MGEPVFLVGEFEEFGSERSWEDLPFDVRTRLIQAINARIRVNRGPERMSRTEIKERVLQDSRVQDAVAAEVSRGAGTEKTFRKKADAYVDEIAADQHIQVHHFLYYVLKWLLYRIFDGLDLKESQFSALKRKNEQGSLIFVSCHKSHLDYLMIGFLCFVNQMAIPFMAAGKNLSFWPVGPILRNAGAFFIRRSFRGLALYPQVFAAYLKVLVSEKVNINFYIEGGRSRTGKLLQPKVGMLAFLLQTIEERSVDDLLFVPTFVGYDQVPEERSFLSELAGKEKQKETLASFVRSREVLKRRFGTAYIRFHDPVSYRQFLVARGLRLEDPTRDEAEHRKLVNDFACYLMTGIAKVGVVTAVELAAAALVSTNRLRINRDRLFSAVSCYSEALKDEGIGFSGSLDNLETGVDATLGLFAVRGFIQAPETEESEQEKSCLVIEQKRAYLDFYRNSLVNYLWPHALAATVVLSSTLSVTDAGDELLNDFRFLKEILSKEVIENPTVTDKDLLARIIAFFADKGWMPADNSGDRRDSMSALHLLKGILGDTIAAYHLVLAASERLDGAAVSEKEFIRRTRKTAHEIYPQQQDRALPALASVTVGNALAKFAEMGALDYDPERKVVSGAGRPEKSKQIKEYLARVLTLTV